MKKKIIISMMALLFVLTIPVFVQAKFSHGIKKPVRMIVFNQSEQVIELEVWIDGKSVYEDKASIADSRPAIVEERSFLIKPGIHSVKVKDSTRHFRDEKKIELKERINLLIFLDSNHLDVEINDREKLNFQ